jgi:hypothetical protein
VEIRAEEGRARLQVIHVQKPELRIDVDPSVDSVEVPVRGVDQARPLHAAAPVVSLVLPGGHGRAEYGSEPALCLHGDQAHGRLALIVLDAGVPVAHADWAIGKHKNFL